jgi:prepilin-type N-terminal cleavage/methylation domain-containing protein
MMKLPFQTSPRRAVRPGRPGARRGLTLAEVAVSMAIAGMIAVVVAGILRESGLAIKNMYAITRTRSTRMNAIDQVRYRLIEAERSSVTISNSDRKIEFHNPNLVDPNDDTVPVFSSFEFIPGDTEISPGTLMYDENIDDDVDPITAARGPINFTFELVDLGNGEHSLVILKVKSAAHVSFGDVDIQDGETLVYLRN